MPNSVIERQHLVPMYQHIAVEAESLEQDLSITIERTIMAVNRSGSYLENGLDSRPSLDRARTARLRR